MAKKTKIPTVQIPPKPAPPLTREQTEYACQRWLSNQVKVARDNVAEWKARIAKADDPQRVVYELSWSGSFFQAASQYMVYSDLYNNLNKDAPEPRATVETLAEYATTKAIDMGRFPRMSTSTADNFSNQCTLAAWADAAESLRGWVKSLQASDAYYAAEPQQGEWEPVPQRPES